VILPGANWCDLVKYADGRVELVFLAGATVSCAQRWAVDAGQPLLYLRAAADGHGRVCAIGQGNEDGQAWATIEGGAPFSLGATHGVFSVVLFGTDDGWTLFVQSAPDRLNAFRILGNGVISWSETNQMPPTSQGFLYVASNGQPITQDQGRGAIPGLALPSPALSDPTVWVGQSMDAPTLALFDSETGAITPLHTPGGQPPHLVESGGTYYVCSYVEGGAWLSTHRRPFAAVTPPAEPPPIDPGEPDMSVRDVPNLIRVIEQVKHDFPVAWRNCHRPDKSRDEAEEFARRAAYACSLADARFGLNGKRGDPNTISQDCVCFKHDDGRESVIDFGGGAGGDNPTVQWSIVGHYQVPGPPLQLWIRAERVGGSTPAPNPNPTPQPQPAPGRPFPAPRWPEDVFLHALTRYINEALYLRDKPEENPGGSRTASRGALMWFVPIATEELIADIVAHGNQAPTPERWWALADRVAVKAIDFYRRTAPPE
jgi:hypothetical protein